MSEWQETTLGEVITLQRGFDLTEKSATPGPYPVISSGGFSYTHEEAKAEGPGVITGRKGVLGKVHYCETDYWPHDTTLWVRDFKGACPRYIYYFLQTLPLADLDAGASNPTLNRNHAHLLAVRVPDYSTQERIVDILGSIDDLIENNRRRIEVLEEMAQAIYREWFVHFRFPGHEDGTFVDSPLGPIPQGWKVAKLGDLAEVNARSRKPSTDEIVRYLDISCLGDREVISPPSVDGGSAPGRARRCVQPGDVVWSMVRPNRRAHALLVAPGEDWIASTGLAVLSPSETSSAFLFESVSYSGFSDYLVSQESGSAYPAVKPNDFEGALLAVPTSELEAAFASVVQPMHDQGWLLRETSDWLAQIRDLLLPKLVTGEIDVSDLSLDDLAEVAS